MSFLSEGRVSDSPYVEMIWRGRARSEYAPNCPADSRWNMLLLRQNGGVQVSVEDLDALITEAGGSAFVFGMSSCAALALEAAARSLAIMKLALYEPPFMVDDSRPRPPNLAAQYTELRSSGHRGDAVELFMTKAMGVPAEVVTQMRQAPMWPGLEAVAHTLAYDATIMGDGSLPTRRAASVTVPTLVINGGASPAWARNAVQALADVLPNAQRRTLEGQTHDVAPEVLAPVLEMFFKTAPAGQLSGN